MEGSRPILVFTLILVIGISALSLAAYSADRASSVSSHSTEGIGGCLPSEQNHGCGTYSFGTLDAGTIGWLMPANTTILTSFVTTQPMKGIASAYANVFTYQLGNPVLSVGLYINGNLIVESNTTLSDQGGSYGCPPGIPCGATIEGQVLRGVGGPTANFSMDTWTAGTGAILKSAIAAPADVTVAVTFNKPVWVQTDSSTDASSYISSVNFVDGHFPASLASILPAALKAPHTLSIQVECSG